MRRNGFGDIYCHTADEARRTIENHENGWEVYQGQVEPPEGEFKATGEILDNVSGELVCYIEADTESAVTEILAELKLNTP